LTQREAAPPAEVADAAIKRERVARAGAVATGAAGGGNETAKVMAQPDKPMVLLPSVAAWSLVGLGVAVVLVATALIVRKRAAILAKWAGAAAAPSATHVERTPV
jgi:hypothetical protein